MAKLDQIDRKLLDILQRDATLSVSKISEVLGLSPTPCWNRLQRLHNLGYIKGKIALLDRDLLNVGITVFIFLKTDLHDRERQEKLRKAFNEIPEILDVYGMSGDVDYLIRAVLPDLQAHDKLYKKLIQLDNFTKVSSMFAIETIKSTTIIPLSYA
jgi:Transcriptional regulators